LFTLVFTFISCEKEYKDFGRITYFADIVIAGDETVFIPSGSAYTDEGATATENDVPIDVEASSNVNTDAPGSYSVSYSATNSDGFDKVVSRSVIVYDAAAGLNQTDFSGTYSANVVRNGSEAYTGSTVTLDMVIPGIYIMSDWIGGFYAQGRAYGDAYGFIGYMQITEANEIVILSMSNPWGDPFDGPAYDTSVDPGTHAMAWKVSWIGTYEFVVDMAP
jgi:hypothetical protein